MHIYCYTVYNRLHMPAALRTGVIRSLIKIFIAYLIPLPACQRMFHDEVIKKVEFYHEKT